MKVLFITRASLYENRGGDTVQITNTAKYLKALGVQTTIRFSNETIDYREYDLIHFFNIIRPADILYHIKQSQKPYVVSTIFVDYSEFDTQVRKGFAGLLFKILPKDYIEYAKVMARAIRNKERIVSANYLLLGQRTSIRRILRGARLLLPNSFSEYRRLFNSYGEEQRYQVIPNAVDTTIFNPDRYSCKKKENMVLCVGRIEGLKNQLNLIRALNGTRFQLVLIGAAATNQQGYFKQCRAEAGENIHFIDRVDQDRLAAFYAEAQVHVLPSWFETTGLSSLEAAAMGCNIVITDKGDTREYFRDFAYYCEPVSPESIRKAIEQAACSAFREELRALITTQYTWPVAATKTLEAYQKALSL